MQYSRVPQASRSCNMCITSSHRALGTGKLSTCYALYSTVLIFNGGVTSLLTCPILENFYTRASSWLKSIASKIYFLFSLRSFTSIYSSLSSFNLALYANWVYCGLII